MLEGGGVVSLVGAGGKTSLMFRMARELTAIGESVLLTTTTKIFVPEEGQAPCLILSDSYDTVVYRARNFLEKHLYVMAASGRLPNQRKIVGFHPEVIDRLWQAGLFQWIIVEADGAAGRALKVPADHEPVLPACTKWLIGVAGLVAVGKPLSDNWVFRPELFARRTALFPGRTVTADAIAEALVHPDGIMKGAPASALRLAFLNQADLPGALRAGRRIAALLARRRVAGLNRVVIGQILFEPPVLECTDMNPDYA
jgi:probable selenium-dependent hydroxylase accessory protein YqeC